MISSNRVFLNGPIALRNQCVYASSSMLFRFRFNKKVFLEINLSPTHSDDMYPIITNITELCLNLFLKTTFVVLIYTEPKTPLKLNLP